MNASINTSQYGRVFGEIVNSGREFTHVRIVRYEDTIPTHWYHVLRNMPDIVGTVVKLRNGTFKAILK